ncbi:MAG: hypothetical protein V4773_09150 [Verrucomicrobiota bacterium]
MLRLLKKKSEASSAPLVPAWHPNFRNVERLPDIKVVRTAFFVNFAAITLVVFAAGYFGFDEWRTRGLRAQLAQVQLQIDRDKRVSDQAVALFKKFQAEEAKIVEADTFVQSKTIVSPIVMRLGETLPENIAIDSLEFRDAGLAMRLSIRGAPDVASGRATQYLDKLRADKQLAIFDTFDFTATPTFNPGTGRMTVEFFLRLKNAPGGRK